MTTTTVPSVITAQATVAEASQVADRDGNMQWALRLEIPEISKFPVPCYMSMEQVKVVLKGSSHVVTMRRGRLKGDKDGTYRSDYYWDMVEWDTKTVPYRQAPAPASSQRAQERTGGAYARGGQGGTGFGEEEARLTDSWANADTQSRISWAQAVNLAQAKLGVLGGSAGWGDSPAYLEDLERWANLFYPLIRKGPTGEAQAEPEPEEQHEPTEEELGFGTEQGHVLEEAPARKGRLVTPDGPPPSTGWPARGEKETAFNYAVRVASVVYGKDRDQMLKAIGGYWLAWEKKHQGEAVEAAMLRLAE